MAQTRRSRRSRRRRKNSSLIGLVFVILCLVVLAILANPSRRNELPPSAVETEPPRPAANPFSPEDFFLDSRGYMTCSAAKTMLGVDVSEHQQEIDWAKVAEAGIEFAYIRVGYRGYDQGGIHLDEFFERNYAGASAAGLKIGVYFYSQAISPEEANEEAQFVRKTLGDRKPDLPIVYDWEWVSEEARTGQMTSEGVTACTDAFCKAVQKAGYDAAFYFNQELASRMFRLGELTSYPFWIAQYEDALTFAYEVKLWQYTASGSVPGISGSVDMNLYFE